MAKVKRSLARRDNAIELFEGDDKVYFEDLIELYEKRQLRFTDEVLKEQWKVVTPRAKAKVKEIKEFDSSLYENPLKALIDIVSDYIDDLKAFPVIYLAKTSLGATGEKNLAQIIEVESVSEVLKVAEPYLINLIRLIVAHAYSDSTLTVNENYLMIDREAILCKQVGFDNFVDYAKGNGYKYLGEVETIDVRFSRYEK